MSCDHCIDQSDCHKPPDLGRKCEIFTKKYFHLNSSAVYNSSAKNGTSTYLKGIPFPIQEPDKDESSSPIAQCEVPPPRIMEGVQRQGGDETSVFPHLAPEPESGAMEVEGPTCNSQVPADTVGHIVRLPPYPTVSCRITPTGETLLSFQWNNK